MKKELSKQGTRAGGPEEATTEVGTPRPQLQALHPWSTSSCPNLGNPSNLMTVLPPTLQQTTPPKFPSPAGNVVPTKQAPEGKTSEDKEWLLVLPARVSHPSLEPQFPQCKIHPHIRMFPYCGSTHYILGPILEAKDRALHRAFTIQYRRQTISKIKDTLSDFSE